MVRIDPSEFTPNLIAKLAQRASQKCSNPSCNRNTSGGHTLKDRAVIIGEAAHIYGQKPGSARFDETMSPEERGDINNAIWLCGSCHKMVDNDAIKFNARILLKWKDEHEANILESINSKKERTSLSIKPVLDLNDNLGYTGGPDGLFHTFTVINKSDLDAIECKFYLEGFGFQWNPEMVPSSGISIEPRNKIEIKYQIPTFNEDSISEPIKDLQFVMNYKNLEGQEFETRRNLNQVKKGIYYEFQVGNFIPPKLLMKSNSIIRFREILAFLGGAHKGLFEINIDGIEQIIIIGISPSLISVWNFNTNEEIKSSIISLGLKKINKMIYENKILKEYIFTTFDFPAEYQNGYSGYKKTLASLDF